MNKERRRSINNIKANIARLKKEITDMMHLGAYVCS